MCATVISLLVFQVPSELISLDADRIMKLDAPNSAASSQVLYVHVPEVCCVYRSATLKVVVC